MSDLAVLTVYYNPCGYRSTVANFLRFHEALGRQGVRLQGVELAFGDGEFYLPELEGIARVRTTDVLWQYERMINHQVSQLPPQYTKVAWVDTDILFENDKWYEQASRALDRYPVIQLFGTAIWLDQQGRDRHQMPGIVYAAKQLPHLLGQPMSYHPGFAWAARREFMQTHGVFDRCILGGNDRILAQALYGAIWVEKMATYPLPLQREIERFTHRVFADVQWSAGYVSGAVRHLWHGNLANRQYALRDHILVEGDFEPHADIRIGENGAWHWATDKPRLHEAVRGYFYSRREDGEVLPEPAS